MGGEPGVLRVVTTGRGRDEAGGGWETFPGVPGGGGGRAAGGGWAAFGVPGGGGGLGGGGAVRKMSMLASCVN